jgi:D-lactate dehydrogenase
MIDYQSVINQLSESLHKDRVITDPDLCHTLGTDASCYQLTPKVIVKIESVSELQKVLSICNQHQTPYTFRAAGTSLSGQAISDSVLITLSDQWQQYKILDDGHKIKLQAGIIGASANKYLSPYSRKIGPDPASINACKIGGIAANNASGMCCGTAQNTYHTVTDMSLVLADGTYLDTADKNSVSKFKITHEKFLKQLSQLAINTKNNRDLADLIRHKYRLKNTCGFSINALVDYQDPLDILTHLMIGSEGSLGFISDITLTTIADNKFKSTALYIFEDIETACEVVSKLSKVEISAVELMDGKSLTTLSKHPLISSFAKKIDPKYCGLLMETQAQSESQLNQITSKVIIILKQFNCIQKIDFTTDNKISSELWNLRKGLFPAVGAVRKKGTSVIIEDVAFPIQKLAAATQELQQLLHQYGYHNAIIFGHALNGNLHFVFTPDFAIPQQVIRYKQFMQALSHLVAVKYQGSLKAEHGTGRNMAPFVELEWGKQAYSLMQQIKHLFDPKNIVNPGVIINPNNEVHIENLKQFSAVDELIDQCIECGFCEPQCPSKDLSLTPRQRIVMYRQLQTLRQQKNHKQAQKLARNFDYLGVDTCAATGLCEQSCPVGINTAELVKKIRKTRHGNSTKLAHWISRNFLFTTTLIKWSFGASRVLQKFLPKTFINTSGYGLRKLSKNTIPIWFSEYPTYHFKSKPIPNQTASQKNKIIYVAACGTRTWGTQQQAKDHRNLDEVIVSLLEKAGYQVIIPENINQLCCGLPFSSKGFEQQAKKKSLQLEKQLLELSVQGKIPVLIDNSSCAKQTSDTISNRIKIQDPIEFISQNLLEKIKINPLDETIMLHITCSSRLQNLAEKIISIAKQCATNVIIPEHIQCCGWAGDKGFTTPELNQSALKTLKQQIPQHCTRGYSTNISCEIGLSHHSGIPYQSIMYLLDEVSG